MEKRWRNARELDGGDAFADARFSDGSEDRGKVVKAVVVSCVFPPEPVVSSRTSFDVAGGMAERGHDVTVLTPFPNRPAGRIYPGFRRRLFKSERSNDGVRIIRCFAFFSTESAMASRLAENISFGITAALRLLFLRKPDVVYLNTWPIVATSLAVAVARLRRIPAIVSVQDVYPESLVSQGRTRRSSLLHRSLLAIDGFVVRNAAGVIVISSQFAKHYAKTRGIDESAITIVPNWLPHGASDTPPAAAAECRARNGIPMDAFLLTFGGNVGAAAGVETVIEAFAGASLGPDVHLLVAGEGTSLEACRRLARAAPAGRIHFQPEWRGSMDVLHAADAVMLPTRGTQSTASVPSKMISYLFSARPVIAMAVDGSATAEVVRAAECGVVIPPDDPQSLADSIAQLVARSKQERRQMGESGYRWASANVTRDVCLPRVLDLMDAMANRR
ncbi:MAG TPA: glycosyltransferase family 4 protein [Thermoanaerobaculia bacterium]|nr:glycosyltransferase family 4 protein [Thermoanaerobaculia bacterium]